MTQHSPNIPYTVTVDENEAGQRLDNYLIKHLKGVPRGHLYRIVRKGEVRVNKKRCKAQHRLKPGDEVRIPPLRVSQRRYLTPSANSQEQILGRIVFEDEQLIILDKPAGWPVHGGTGCDYGLIETLRLARAHTPYLELAHRLDKDTSGCLMIAKSRKSLTSLQRMLAAHDESIVKTYTCLVKGRWKQGNLKVDSHLSLSVDHFDGKKSAQINDSGKSAVTWFKPTKVFSQASLVKVKLTTGRMHQIRAHAAHLGHPLAGDDKYGDFQFNRQFKKHFNLNRIFLHAARLRLRHPLSNQPLSFSSPLPEDLNAVLQQLDSET